MFGRVMISCAVVLALGVPALAAPKTKTVRDWQATCDEYSCSAEATGDNGLAMGGQGYRLRIARAAGADGAWGVSLLAHKVPHPASRKPITFAVDDGVPVATAMADLGEDTYDVGDQKALEKLFPQLRKGHHVVVSIADASEGFSLSGLTAILLFMDDAQGRVGNSDQVAATDPGSLGDTVSGDDIAALKAKIASATPTADCQWQGEGADPEGFKASTYKLGEDLTLIEVLCLSGAYQTTSVIYYEDASGVHPLAFPEYSDDLGWSGTSEIGFIGFDEGSKELTAAMKFRGLGDCGTAAHYVWAERGFKLMEYRFQGDCSGAGSADQDKWPVVYQAEDRD